MSRFNHACTFVYVHAKAAADTAEKKVRETLKKAVNDESGMEIIAIILILAVVIAMVVVFRKQIVGLFNKGAEEIAEETEKLDDEDQKVKDPTSGGNGAEEGIGMIITFIPFFLRAIAML